jgi:uncharacterized MAPEG superfamily protein
MQVYPELKLLGFAVLIGLVQLAWAAIAAQPQRGREWNVGPRDEPCPLTGMAGRLERAFANYRETFPLFAALVIATYLGGKTGDLTLWGSIAYVVARAVYVPLYAFGVSYFRSFVWLIATGGIVALLVALFL